MRVYHHKAGVPLPPPHNTTHTHSMCEYGVPYCTLGRVVLGGTAWQYTLNTFYTYHMRYIRTKRIGKNILTPLLHVVHVVYLLYHASAKMSHSFHFPFAKYVKTLGCTQSRTAFTTPSYHVYNLFGTCCVRYIPAPSAFSRSTAYYSYTLQSLLEGMVACCCVRYALAFGVCVGLTPYDFA